jgi:hypothetical protein
VTTCPHCESEVDESKPGHACVPLAEPDGLTAEMMVSDMLDVDGLLGAIRDVVRTELAARLEAAAIERKHDGLTCWVSSSSFPAIVDHVARAVSQSLVLTIVRVPKRALEEVSPNRREMQRLDRELWTARVERDALARQVQELKALLAMREARP